MLRKAIKAVPEGNDPVPQKEELGSGQPTMKDEYRRMKLMMSHFEEKMDELSDVMNQHLTRLEHGARQPRLAMEADGQASTKTRECTEGAATAVQAMRGVALSSRDDVVVKSGPAASESCLLSMEMRSSTAAGGLVPTGEASTASETTLDEPPLRFCPTEETDLEPNSTKTWTPYASYESSSFFWRLLAAPHCRSVVDTKSRQDMTFDPGGSQGRLRACPFLGSWRVLLLLCGEVIHAGAVG